jgi:hypothetical protein
MNTSEAAPNEPGRPTRQEFVRALVEHSWARPEAPRPAARPHIVLAVTVFAAVGAIAAGVVLQLVHPIRLPKAATPSPPPAPAAPFTAVSGWDCVPGADYGFTAQGRTSAWYTIATGGWASNGCDGTFETMPAAAGNLANDTSQSALWWFTPSRAMTQCAVMVFRPAAGQWQGPAATAANFSVLAGQDGSPLASFVLDEAADPGSWAAVGTYPVSPEGIAVELTDQGTPRARLAITQVKVSCTG